MSCFYIEDDKYKTCTSNIIFVLAERRWVPKKFSLRGLAWGIKRESTVQERLAVVGDSNKLLAVRNYLLTPISSLLSLIWCCQILPSKTEESRLYYNSSFCLFAIRTTFAINNQSSFLPLNIIFA